MQPARFRQADFSLVKINNTKSMSPAVSSGRSAGSFPEQRLVIEPSRVCDIIVSVAVIVLSRHLMNLIRINNLIDDESAINFPLFDKRFL